MDVGKGMTMLESISESLFDMLVTFYGNGLLTDISDFLQKVNTATQTALTGTVIADAMAIFRGFGAALILLFFLVELLNQQQRELLTFERLIFMMIRLLAVMVVMMNLDVIIQGIITLSSSLYARFSAMAVSGAGGFEIFGQTGPYDYAVIKDEFEDALDIGVMKGLGILMGFLIPWLASRLCYVVAFVVAIGRSVELAVRAVLAPIGVAQLFEEGTRSSGFRNLKKLAGVGLQMLVIAVVLYAASLLNKALMSEAGSGYVTITEANLLNVLQSKDMWTMCAIQLASVGVILKSGSIGNDMAGV